MPTIKGIWKWNEIVSQPASSMQETISFTSNSTQFTSILAQPETTSYVIQYIGNSSVYANYHGEWNAYSAYRIMDFGESEQTVSDTFYNYLTSNAVNISVLSISLANLQQFKNNADNEYEPRKNIPTPTTNNNGQFLGVTDGAYALKEITEVENANNVTSSINSHALTDIFESDGTTVKEATSANDPSAVHFTEQTLTSEQQEQARTNIGAASEEELVAGLAEKQPTGNYALQDGTYSEMTVGNATNAETADKVANALLIRNATGGAGSVLYNGGWARTIDLAPTVTTAYAEIGSNTRWWVNAKIVMERRGNRANIHIDFRLDLQNGSVGASDFDLISCAKLRTALGLNSFSCDTLKTRATVENLDADIYGDSASGSGAGLVGFIIEYNSSEDFLTIARIFQPPAVGPSFGAYMLSENYYTEAAVYHVDIWDAVVS